jgi:RepB DNA-primase from phage plasmid
VTGEERKKRGEKSGVIVERLVRIQLRAMGCEHFDIGIKRDGGEMILRESQGAIHIEKAIKWLRHENAKGAHIYIRPAGAHGLSLLDDLSSEAIERMKTEGYEPAVVVETSPNNFQAWLNHGQILHSSTSTRAAKVLAERFGGDPSSADWRHFGRLAGFTNPKRERQLPSGMRPFAWLRSATGHIYPKAAEFVASIASSELRQERQGGESPRRRRRQARHSGLVSLEEFHRASGYSGDLHRADMAWAKHAAGRGLTLEQIKDELLTGRDLSKKGSRKRQLEYAERTARKAIEQSGA